MKWRISGLRPEGFTVHSWTHGGTNALDRCLHVAAVSVIAGMFFRATRVSVRCNRRCCFCQHDPGRPKAKRQRHQRLRRGSDSTERACCDVTDMTTATMTLVKGTKFGDRPGNEKHTSVGWRLGGGRWGGGGGGGRDGRAAV